ncbi:pentatricopeptide repeat-containing protein At4g38150-like [Zingiber officinale]|uniref:pentatricopeptide repeat-containing protein At4g38150-like n=1 Tax=Zingiber officinale TaxID=94328 RepID=UPI001C4D4EFC|nr:pentatricopeptide repeat-containing protein At4g38150-like [Zingiber officinale]
MQSAVSKLLLSNISRRLCSLPKTWIGERCVPGIGFSTSSKSGRSMRGERGDGDDSEDLFLRNLNFGEEGSGERQRARQEGSFERPSSRPTFRGGEERRKMPPLPEDGIDEASDDLFHDFDLGEDELGMTGSGLQGRSRSRATRRAPPREDFNQSTQASFKDFGRDYMGDFENPQYRSPSGSASGDRIEDSRYGSPYIGSGSEDLGGGQRGRDRIGDSLAQKFNLGPSGQQKKTDEADQNNSDSTKPISLEAPPEDADEIFKKMKETGVIPNAVAMLDGLCKDGLVQEAMKLFGSMREKRTMPEVVIYTAVVEGFCKAAKFDDAKRIFRKMQNNGITPNAFSYKILIQSLCQEKKLEDSVEFCMEMLDAGHQPNAATAIGLVDEFIKEKGVEEADNFVKKLLGRGWILDDKAIREHLNKKGPFSPLIWEAFFGKKASRGPF